MTEYCYLNGKILPLSEAKVSVLDIGLWRGYGIYEGLTAVGTNVFRLHDHWYRLSKGAERLGLKMPVSEAECLESLKSLLSQNGYSRSIIRMVLTGGDVVGGIEYDEDSPTFSIVVKEWTPLPQEIFQKGAKLITDQFQRELPEFKTTNYIHAVNLQKLRKEEGAIEILYLDDEEVLECSTSNIFLVKDSVLVTPEDKVLQGVTRKVAMEVVSGKYGVEERKVKMRELLDADEVFITSSFKDIVPITKIDDKEIKDGEIGEITRYIMESFNNVLASTTLGTVHPVSADFALPSLS